MNTYSIEPIGVIRSDLTTIGSAPRFHTEGAPATFVELDPAHAEKLRDIEPGDEVLVVTMRPGRREGAAALALHRARVVALESGRARLAAIAEVDGTSVIEIRRSREEEPRAPRADPWKFTAPAWPSRYS
ncbi:MAG TPA: hypothetical protein VGF40_03450 [Thermoanaerobaculia bacterium]